MPEGAESCRTQCGCWVARCVSLLTSDVAHGRQQHLDAAVSWKSFPNALRDARGASLPGSWDKGRVENPSSSSQEYSAPFELRLWLLPLSHAVNQDSLGDHG